MSRYVFLPACIDTADEAAAVWADVDRFYVDFDDNFVADDEASESERSAS